MRELSSVKELTIELNHLRVKNGKKPLKAWKGSKEKAVEAIKAEAKLVKPVEKIPGLLDALKANGPEVEAPVKKAPTPKDPTLPDTKPDWLIESEEKPAKELAPIEEMPEPKETFTVVELAIEMEISPKVARAKLRRNVDDLPPRVGKGWTFANDVREALIKLLS